MSGQPGLTASDVGLLGRVPGRPRNRAYRRLSAPRECQGATEGPEWRRPLAGLQTRVSSDFDRDGAHQDFVFDNQENRLRLHDALQAGRPMPRRKRTTVSPLPTKPRVTPQEKLRLRPRRQTPPGSTSVRRSWRSWSARRRMPPGRSPRHSRCSGRCEPRHRACGRTCPP